MTGENFECSVNKLAPMLTLEILGDQKPIFLALRRFIFKNHKVSSSYSKAFHHRGGKHLGGPSCPPSLISNRLKNSFSQPTEILLRVRVCSRAFFRRTGFTSPHVHP